MYRMTVIHDDGKHQWRVGKSSMGLNIDCIKVDSFTGEDEDEETFNVFLPNGAEDELFEYLR